MPSAPARAPAKAGSGREGASQGWLCSGRSQVPISTTRGSTGNAPLAWKRAGQSLSHDQEVRVGYYQFGGRKCLGIASHLRGGGASGNWPGSLGVSEGEPRPLTHREQAASWSNDLQVISFLGDFQTLPTPKSTCLDFVSPRSPENRQVHNFPTPLVLAPIFFSPSY